MVFIYIYIYKHLFYNLFMHFCTQILGPGVCSLELLSKLLKGDNIRTTLGVITGILGVWTMAHIGVPSSRAGLNPGNLKPSPTVRVEDLFRG